MSYENHVHFQFMFIKSLAQIINKYKNFFHKNLMTPLHDFTRRETEARDMKENVKMLNF